MQVLSGLLHLGNVMFCPDEEDEDICVTDVQGNLGKEIFVKKVQGPILQMIFFHHNSIRWKFHSVLIQVVVKWSLWNFAHEVNEIHVSVVPFYLQVKIYLKSLCVCCYNASSILQVVAWVQKTV